MILTPEQEMIRDSVRSFARERLAPNAAQWDRDSTFPREALRGLAEMGLFGIAVAEEGGGAGMDYLALALAVEEIAAGDASTSTVISVMLNGSALAICSFTMASTLAICSSVIFSPCEKSKRRRSAVILLPFC